MVAYLQKSEGTTARNSANREVELTATIDGQVKTITKTSLRRHLKLKDNGGVTTLMGVKKLEQKVKTTKARRKARIVLSEDEEDVEDSSKHERKISEIDKDPTISLVQPEQEMEHGVGIAKEITWFQDVDVEIKEKNNIRSGEKGASEVSSANIVVTTAEVSTAAENLVYIIRSAEKKKDKGCINKAKPLQEEEFYKATQEQEKQEVVTEADPTHVIDWSDPAVWDQTHTFVPIDSEDKEKDSEKKGSRKKTLARKRAGEKQSDQSAKRQKIKDDAEKEDFKEYLNIVPKEGMNFKALQTKYPLIDWEIYTEDSRVFSSTEPNDDKERALWVELKRLFELDTNDLLELQRYMHDPLTWRLYAACGVHHVSTKTGLDMFMLVDKDYPLTRGLPMLMLVNKLQANHHSEMADELLNKIFILANRPRQ
ncbi:hypothetical protein Tco_1373317 [Tanacetum coccineum]